MTRASIQENAIWAAATAIAIAICVLAAPLAIAARALAIIRDAHATSAQLPRRGHARHGDSTSHGIG